MIDKNVQLTPSNLKGDGVTGELQGQKVALHVSVINGSLVPEVYDRIDYTAPNSTTEVYTYKKNQTTVGIVTVTYTDSTKDILLNVVRT